MTVYIVWETRILYNDELNEEEPVDTRIIGGFDTPVEANKRIERAVNTRVNELKTCYQDKLSPDGRDRLVTSTEDSSRSVALIYSDGDDYLLVKYQYNMTELVLGQDLELGV